MLTKGDIAARYPDADWHRKLLLAFDIVTLLRECIIDSKYRISDEMNESIVLSEYGSRIQRTLTTKHSVGAKEARLACMLEFAQDEPFLDLERTDFPRLLKEISRQIGDQSIRFPHILGRQLYDKAAEMFPNLRVRLNPFETRRLLENTPNRVFQVGNLVTGPLGLVSSAEYRRFPPTTRVPLQHCSDVSCSRVHATFLSSDFDAPINQSLPKVNKVLEMREELNLAWAEFVTDLLDEHLAGSGYDDFDAGALPIVAGDCLTETELGHLAYWLYDSSDNQTLREECRKAGIPATPDVETKIKQSDLATKLQIVWMAKDEHIHSALDELIRTKTISIAPGEVRRARINEARAGEFMIRASFGELGVRLSSSGTGLPLLRLQRLIESLYNLDDPLDAQEVQWQLRGVEGISLQARLVEFVRVTDPATAVKSLVLSSRRNIDKALTQLRMSPADMKDPRDVTGLKDADDETIVSRILWKLGFAPAVGVKITSDFWRHHQKMRHITRDAATNQTVGIEDFRSSGTSFFVELERVLDESLMFSWWALTRDHCLSSLPFEYTPSQGEAAWQALQDYWKESGATEKVNFTSRRTLWTFGKSFSALAGMLRAIVAEPGPFVRTATQRPSYMGKTALRRFPFEHVIPFIDLLPSSRDAILAGLDFVADTLQRHDVHKVRNDMSHYQRSPFELERLESALDGARSAVERLENLGFARMTYTRVMTQRDEWGRASHVFRGADGNEVSFTTPSPFDWVPFPPLSAPQFLLPSAVFASPNEMLRFRRGSDSEFSRMWSDYPRRRRSPESVLTEPAATEGEILRSSHRVLPTQR